MGWKETLLTEGEVSVWFILGKVRYENEHSGKTSYRDDLRDLEGARQVALAQAKISYEARERVGIKHVAEWIKSNLYISPPHGTIEQSSGRFIIKISGFVFEDDWLAQLKKWGME